MAWLTEAEINYWLDVEMGEYFDIFIQEGFTAQREYIEWKKSQRQGMKEGA